MFLSSVSSPGPSWTSGSAPRVPRKGICNGKTWTLGAMAGRERLHVKNVARPGDVKMALTFLERRSRGVGRAAQEQKSARICRRCCWLGAVLTGSDLKMLWQCPSINSPAALLIRHVPARRSLHRSLGAARGLRCPAGLQMFRARHPPLGNRRGLIGSSPIVVSGSGHGRSFSEASQVRVERALEASLLLELYDAKKKSLPFHRIAAHKKTGGGHSEGRVCV
ncbi:hypothetical protein B0T18DRAFT_152059 [Schizothecium vesticola]|uniref:Uncharacterized protein n=1 Tax=Schizothecium vesticola TaxID=314040 RepID=A0AA40EVU0_9PEZI|nr:hypothetical protein B0T18DRAFT_152059 [Schizothecium vesticola]